jgi:hypothetical protein
MQNGIYEIKIWFNPNKHESMKDYNEIHEILKMLKRHKIIDDYEEL